MSEVVTVNSVEYNIIKLLGHGKGGHYFTYYFD